MAKAKHLPALTKITFAQLQKKLEQIGAPKFAAKQVWDWVYKKKVSSYDGMTNISKDLRENLAAVLPLCHSELADKKKAQDETGKFLVSLYDGDCVESVLIRDDKNRVTLCLSSQVGCAVGCRFCASGLFGLKRNLEAFEIIDQFILAHGLLTENEKIDNVVFMGMGEPMHNFENVKDAIAAFTDKDRFAMSASRITVSTAVHRPELMNHLAKQKPAVHLAVSLHAGEDAIRHDLIPHEKKVRLKDLVYMAKDYAKATGERVTFEYAMVAGVNDAPESARSLSKLLMGVPCMINLIPMNKVPETGLKRPGPDKVKRFAEILRKNGLKVQQRRRKGENISAACGQLRLQQFK